MKTTACAFLILAGILATGIWFNSTLSKTCAKYETELNVCFSQASTKHWIEATRTLEKLKERLEARKTLFAAFSHHHLLEQIKTALTRTEAATRNQDFAQFAIEYNTLKEAVATLKESENPNAANIF